MCFESSFRVILKKIYFTGYAIYECNIHYFNKNKSPLINKKASFLFTGTTLFLQIAYLAK